MAGVGARAAGAGAGPAAAAVNPLFKHVKEDDLYHVFRDILYDHPRNDIDEKGRTPLHYARSVEVADTLLNPVIKVKEPIDINARDYYGYTPLMEVIKGAEPRVGHFLIDKGANVNVFGFDGKTARTIHINGSIRRRLNEMGATLGEEDNDWMAVLDLEPAAEAEPENNTGMSKVNTSLFSEGGRRKRKSTRKSKSNSKRTRKSKKQRC